MRRLSGVGRSHASTYLVIISQREMALKRILQSVHLNCFQAGIQLWLCGASCKASASLVST